MKSGTFQAFGGEGRRFRDPRVAFGQLGVAQFLAYAFLNVIKVVPPSQILLISFVVAVIALVDIVLLRIRQTPPGMNEISYVDHRDVGGALNISYRNTRNVLRPDLVVDKIKVDSRRGLYSGSGKAQRRMGDTKAAILIYFRGQNLFYLALGFPSADEMNKIYEQLK